MYYPIIASMMALTIPQNTPQKRCRNNDSLSGDGGLRQASGVERLAKCRVFGINRADGEKRFIHSNPRKTIKKPAQRPAVKTQTSVIA